jgi:chorismate mutase
MGVLSDIINNISKYKGNILTINQDMPIHNLAYVSVMIDAKDMTVSVYELISELKKIQKVKDVSLVAFE